MAEYTITKENFQELVLDASQPVLVDFWATWCGPCRMLAPILEELAAEHPEIRVGKVNVDEQPELAGAFQIESIPTVILFRDGKPVTGFLGYRPKDQIEALLS